MTLALTLFDYVVIGVLVLSVLLGLFRGMVKEVLSLANWQFWGPGVHAYQGPCGAVPLSSGQ